MTRLSPDMGLQRALAQLPEHERRALELRVIDELPYREVARTLAIRPAAARLRVSRALRRSPSISSVRRTKIADPRDPRTHLPPDWTASARVWSVP